MDLNRSVKAVVTTGKVFLGLTQTRRAVKEGKARLVIVSSNCPQKEWPGVNVLEFPGTNAELGASCGKPFPVSVFAVLEPGESDILSLRNR